MQFGAHESISGGVFNAIERGQTATCDIIQMFNKSNSQWRAKKIEQAELDKYFEMIKETGVTVATSHSSYLINIASPVKELNEKSYKALKEEMERCQMLKIPNLVLHPGSHVGTGEEAGIIQIIKNLNKLFKELKNNNVCLLLETTAGQGSNLGYTFEQIGEMIDGVKIKNLVIHQDVADQGESGEAPSGEKIGILAEVLRADDGLMKKFGQTIFTISYKGTIKAFHWHKK